MVQETHTDEGKRLKDMKQILSQIAKTAVWV
jgi:hypothetical protein